MTNHVCIRASCGRPMRHDTALICAPCGSLLRRHLEDVAKVAGDITITVAKLSKVTRGAGSADDLGWWKEGDALEAIPLPVDLDAARRHDTAAGELTTWARHIVETRGHVNRRWIGHPTRPPQRMHPLREAATTLAESVEWLRHRPEADEAWPAILAACGELVRIVDTGQRQAIVGRCPCGHWLYAVEGHDTVRCWGCATSYDVAASREALRVELEDRAMTGAEIATMAGFLGIADREKARLMVKVWAQRGHLEPIAEGPRYRFGDALPLLLVAYARAA